MLDALDTVSRTRENEVTFAKSSCEFVFPDNVRDICIILSEHMLHRLSEVN